MDTEDTVILTKATTNGLPVAPAALAIPRSLGPVRLLKQIGVGGMGAVWLGRHELLGRDVAVKFLLNIVTSDQDPQFAQFIEGAKASAALRHPGLNVIHDANVERQVPYLVMEYIEGPSLHALMRSSGPLPAAAVAAIVGAVCEPVAVLHDHGVVHRDIKPANILVSLDARVVVTDFGLACFRSLGEGAAGGAAHAVAGTPPYMAPEMFDGAVTPRTDVYALGVMAYEMLAGRRPFDGSVAEVEQRHRQEQLPREPLLQRGVPESVCDVLERATHKNPMFRYKTARHFAEGLVSGLPEGVRPRSAEDVLSRLIAGQRLGTAGGGGGGAGAATPQSPGMGPIDGGSGTPGAYYEKISTLAEVKRKAVPTPVPRGVEPGSSPQAAPEAARCRRCGYALLPHHSGPCPECGHVPPFTAPAATPGSGTDVDRVPHGGEAGSVAPLVSRARSRPAELRPRRLGRWLVCLPLAAAIGTLAAVGLDELASVVFPDASIEESAKAGGLAAAGGGLTVLLLGFPSLLLACFLFMRLVPPLPRDRVTRCGGCGYALSSLREPKCPECGRPI